MKAKMTIIVEYELDTKDPLTEFQEDFKLLTEDAGYLFDLINDDTKVFGELFDDNGILVPEGKISI